MNILQIQARLKDLSDQQLQQVMQQGGAGMAPEYLVLAELNRRAGMRQSQAASQPIDNTTVAQEVMAAPGLPQAVGNQMAQAMRPEDAQQSTARFAEGGIVGLQEGGFPPRPVSKPGSVARGPSTEVSSVMFDRLRALGIDPDTLDIQVIRQIEAESSGNPTAKAHRGIVNRRTGKMEYARGLMQALPSTAEDPGYDVPNIREVARSLGVDPTGMSTVQLLENPKVNIGFGTAYRRGMRNEFGGDEAKALAAYQGGPGNVKRKGLGGIGPQNTEYVEKLAGGAPAQAAGYDTPDTHAPALPMRTTPVYAEEDLNIVSAAPPPEKKGLFGLGFLGLSSGGAIPTGPDGVSYPTPLPQMKPEGIGYRVSEPSALDLESPQKYEGQYDMNSEYTLPRISEPSALDLESLQKYEEQYGPIPEAPAPAKDSQSWADWLYNLLNPRSDAQKRRDAYVPTVEDSNMFGYAEGGIVQAYDGGGIVDELNREYTPGEIAAMLRARGASTPLNPSGIVMPSPLALPPLPPSLPEPRTPAPRRRGVLEGIGNAVGSAASGGGMNYGISPNAGTIIPDLNLPPVDVGLLGQSLANQDYYRQGKELGLTPQQTSEAMSRGVPIEGLGQYKLDFVAEPIPLGSEDVVLPEPPTPTAPLPTRGMPPTAPPTPAVVTPPTPTVAAPSVSLPAATPLQVGPAPKFDEKAYTQAVSSFGVPGGVSDLTRESRRNAMLALAKAGFALAGSKEVTAGGAIGEAAKTGIAAYEAGAKDIAAQKEARRKEGIAQARQEMLDRRAMSQEQYKRYMDTVTAQQAAAARGDTRAYRNASLELQKYGIEATMARAAMTDRAAQAREAAAVTRLELGALQDELTRLNDPITVNMLSTLPEAQRTAALADINRRKAQIQARLDAFTGVSGIAGPPTPGVIDLTK